MLWCLDIMLVVCRISRSLTSLFRLLWCIYSRAIIMSLAGHSFLRSLVVV